MKRYTHLSEEERVLISHYHDNGLSIGGVALALGRDKSTISREIRRNKNKCGYNPQTAKARYLSRRQRSCRLDKLVLLRDYVMDRLHEGFSPETIALRLKEYGHLEEFPTISHEAIYQWLYRPPQKKEKLYRLLVRSHAKRGRKKRAHRGKIKDRISIHERPAAVLDRKEIGHWEADLMSFRGNTQHLLVMHERKTRYTAAVALASKSAPQTLNAILTFLGALPKSIVKSITFDNGLEFASHSQITKKIKIPTYFCDVYASWQKGGIENMNGRLRRDLPRKTDLKSMNQEELEMILTNHNLMPRKILGAKSPIEALANHLGNNIIFLFSKGVALQT